jgi:large conductance mechanosensitive channel
VIDFGAFISAIINFVLIAFVVFMLVRSYNKAKATAEKVMRGRGDGSDDVPVARTCPYCGEEIADDAVRCPHCTSILPNASAADVSAMDGTR